MKSVSSDLLSRLVIAALVTGVADGLFSSTLAAFAYGSTVTRLWQGVASDQFETRLKFIEPQDEPLSWVVA